MITKNEILYNLDFKYPQLRRAFGSLYTFYYNLESNYQNIVNKYLADILNFSGKLIIISPLYLRFTLFDTYDQVDQEALVYEEPYKVYNSDKELLYSVSSHRGIFGNSILDDLLNIEFKPGSLFYLDYLTYRGRKQIMLITGRRLIF